MPSPTSSSSTSPASQTASPSINALIGGDKWGGTTGTGVTLDYSFPWTTSGTANFAGPDGTVNYSALNEHKAGAHYGLSTAQQAAARSALQSWANVAKLTFSEVAETSSNVGDIRFAWTSAIRTDSAGSQAWGWTQEPRSYLPSAGDVWISTLTSSATDPDWSPGSYNSFSLVHELGHALGLTHPFEATPALPGGQDSRQYTVMSYTNHPHSLFVRVTQNADGSSSLNSFNVVPDTPMLLDVAAMQYLYGTNLSYKTGDDVYTFDPKMPFLRTLWDADGTDTISVANFAKGCVVDLQQGHFSKIAIESDPTSGINWNAPPPTPTYDGTDNLAIAYGCVIENAIGGSGSDTLVGNGANNDLTGGAGNDALDGGAGIDTALYSGPNTDYRIAPTGSGFTIQDTTGTTGIDSIVNVERLQFSNAKWALDLDGNAGTCARILGAVFGASFVSNRQYVGIGLGYLDGGTSYPELILLALNARLGAGFSNADEVNLLYQHLVGDLPSAADLNYWVGTITSGQYSQASLATMAADFDLNETNINLVGLAQTGIEYS